jgi:WD40 repeat protein
VTPRDEVLGVAFAARGGELLSVDHDGVVCRWDLARGSLVGQRELGAVITSAASSPDGRSLACGGFDGRVHVLGPDGQVVRTCRPHVGRVTALTFSPDGRSLLSGACDGSVALSEVDTGTSRPCVAPLLGRVVGVAFARDGKHLLATDAWASCATWERATRQAFAGALSAGALPATKEVTSRAKAGVMAAPRVSG